MPDCPQCGTWNPDDKQVCWRCQTPLPKPEPRRTRGPERRILGLPYWLWIVMAIILLVNLILPIIFSATP